VDSLTNNPVYHRIDWFQAFPIVIAERGQLQASTTLEQ
jgi:hypothetical protein